MMVALQDIKKLGEIPPHPVLDIRLYLLLL